MTLMLHFVSGTCTWLPFLATGHLSVPARCKLRFLGRDKQRYNLKPTYTGWQVQPTHSPDSNNRLLFTLNFCKKSKGRERIRDVTV